MPRQLPRARRRAFERDARFLRVLAALPGGERFLSAAVSGDAARPFAELVTAVLRLRDPDVARLVAAQAVDAAQALEDRDVEAVDRRLRAASAGTLAGRLRHRAALREAILARGVVASEAECELVRGRSEHFWRHPPTDEAGRTERRAMDSLLAAWDRSRAETGRGWVTVAGAAPAD